MDLVRLLIVALLYPGLLTALGLGLLYHLVLRGRLERPTVVRATRESLAQVGGVVAAVLGLACLPWPLSPVAMAAWPIAWLAFELAFLLPLLPALISGTPSLARAAIRAAQLGLWARTLIWAALAVALMLAERWSGVALLVHLLALAAALVALPAALGWGPFGPETRITLEGLEAGLAQPERILARLSDDLRGGMLVAAVLVAGLPGAILPPVLGLGLVVVGVALAAALFRNFAGRIPRMTLSAGLRFCLTWSAPLVLVASVALVFV
ncbi:MAG: hypothetical protein AB4911_16860 [Oscillochloridaceae bacterium umkhey_bin13]